MNISLFKNYRELNGYDKYKIVNYYYKNKGVCIGDISKNLNVLLIFYHKDICYII